MTKSITVVAVLALSLSTPELLAKDDATTAQALDLGHGALSAFEAKDFETAFKQFEAAERAAHSPVFVLYMAKSSRELGELVRARALFKDVLEEQLPADAPDSWQRAQQEAKLGLSRIAAEIPSVVITVEGGKPPFEISIAGRTETARRTTGELEIDPGRHEVRALDGRDEVVGKVVSIEPGARTRRIVLTFVATRPPPAPTMSAHEARAPEPDNTWAWTTLGVGAAIATVGLIAGGVAIAKNRDLRSRCEENVCPEEEKGNAESATRWANVSSVGLFLGAVTIGSGVLLWEAQPQADAKPGSAGLSLAPGVSLSGHF